jgi:hypothetical protein
MLASLPVFIVLVHCCAFLRSRRPAGIIALSEVIFTFLIAWLRLDEGSNLIQIHRVGYRVCGHHPDPAGPRQ